APPSARNGEIPAVRASPAPLPAPVSLRWYGYGRTNVSTATMSALPLLLPADVWGFGPPRGVESARLPTSAGPLVGLPSKDSNLEPQIQSLLCYRYTTRQCIFDHSRFARPSSTSR